MKATIYPSRIKGTVLTPGSKSHTIRALLIAAAAEGTSRISNYLDSEDTKSCMEACRALGADIRREQDSLSVTGIGLGGEGPRNGRLRSGGRQSDVVEIDVGNSGTTLYLAAGLAALLDKRVRFTGDNQIKQRPFGPLLDSLSDLGAETESLLGNGCAPAEIRGPLTGGETAIECPTSQYLSSLLLCAPLIRPANKNKSGTGVPKTVIKIPLLYERPYVEISLRWLFKQGVFLSRAADGYSRFEVPGRQEYTAFTERIPGDFSTASFFLCAAAISGTTLTLKGLDPEDPQGDKAVTEMLTRMGCGIEENEDVEGDYLLTISGPDRARGEKLKGIEIDMNATPDALPVMGVTACFAEGETRLVNVPQARLKETDRIRVMHNELSKMGADIEELDDGLVIRGNGSAANSTPLHGCSVDGHGDHRVVMSLAVAALMAEGPTVISSAESAGITVPSFFPLLRSIGGEFSLAEEAAATTAI